MLIALFALGGCGVAGDAVGQQPAAVESAASVPAPAPPPARDAAPWQPDAQQQAILDSLPKDVAAQREELIRLARIPLPSYEERRRFLHLMGDEFPNDHPLRQNELYLLEYYRNLPKPTKAELDALIASLKSRMIFLKGGRFIMGDFGPLKFTGEDKGLTITGDTNNDARPVELDSFSIMKGRVTFGEYDLYLRDTGKPLIDAPTFGRQIVRAYNRRPGYTAWPIKWADADGYCRWLAGVTGQPFKLPTEAQWEYAAREGGKFVAYPMHDFPGIKWQNPYMPDFESVDEALRVLEARAGKKTTFIHPRPTSLTGQNRIGMEGIVDGASEGEWVADWYQEDWFKVSPTRNPAGPTAGLERVARYGAYRRSQSVLSRHGLAPNRGIFFRCALASPKPWR